MYPVFTSIFPSGKSGKLREISRASRKKSGEKYCFFPQQTALKLHSSLLIHTFSCRNTHVPPPSPCPARSLPPSLPGPLWSPYPCPTLPACSCPAQPYTYDQIFPLVPGYAVFFLAVQIFPLPWGKLVLREKIGTKRGKLTNCVASSALAAPYRTLCPGILLGCSLLHVHNVA